MRATYGEASLRRYAVAVLLLATEKVLEGTYITYVRYHGGKHAYGLSGVKRSEARETHAV